MSIRRREDDATIPFEAFDDTHPDHDEWVAAGRPCLAGEQCAVHSMSTPAPRLGGEREGEGRGDG